MSIYSTPEEALPRVPTRQVIELTPPPTPLERVVVQLEAPTTTSLEQPIPQLVGTELDSSGRRIINLAPPPLVVPLERVLNRVEATQDDRPVPVLTPIVKESQIVPIEVESRPPTITEMDEILSGVVCTPFEALVTTGNSKYRVARKEYPEEWDSLTGWNSSMDEYIGKVGICTEEDEVHGLKLEFASPNGDAFDFWFHPNSLDKLDRESVDIEIVNMDGDNGVPPLEKIPKKVVSNLPKVVTLPMSFFIIGVNHVTDDVELVAVVSSADAMFKTCCEQIKRNFSRILGSNYTTQDGGLFAVPVNAALKDNNVACVYELRAKMDSDFGEEDVEVDDIETVYTWLMLVAPADTHVNFDLGGLIDKL